MSGCLSTGCSSGQGADQGDEHTAQQQGVPPKQVHALALDIALVQQGSCPLLGHCWEPAVGQLCASEELRG